MICSGKSQSCSPHLTVIDKWRASPGHREEWRKKTEHTSLMTEEHPKATLLLSFLWMPALLPVACRLLVLPRALLSMASGSPPSQPSPAAGSGYVPGSVSAAFVTCPNEKVAKEIARAVVEKRLAACVNLIPQITSIYEWKGKIEEDREVLMMIKTQSSLVPALTDFVRSVHPYEVAEVIALPVQQGNAPYLHWVHQVTESVSDSGQALP